MESYIKEKTNLFVVCGPGIEPLLMEELKSMGFSKLKQSCRGIYLDDATLTDCFRINYCSRLAMRVLWPLKRFRCDNQDVLYKNAKEFSWEKFIHPKATLAIDANVSGNPNLNNSHFAALVVKDAICDSLRDMRGNRPDIDVEDPDIQLNLHISAKAATLSLDTSGKPLNKRGYRQEGGIAPLQETLAAAVLNLIGYNGTGLFCDPLCGSGTFLIEAAMIATHTPPGYLRTFWGFMSHPFYRRDEWLKVKNSADSEKVPLKEGLFFGMDCEEGVLQSCRKNLRAAGFAKEISLMEGDFYRLKFPSNLNWVVTNPPYGHRIGKGTHLTPMYKRLGESIKGCDSSLSFGILIPEIASPSSLHLPISKVQQLSNGGLPIQLVQGKLNG